MTEPKRKSFDLTWGTSDSPTMATDLRATLAGVRMFLSDRGSVQLNCGTKQACSWIWARLTLEERQRVTFHPAVDPVVFSYDEQCRVLAERFLEDQEQLEQGGSEEVTEADRDWLAQAIQDAIEGWLDQRFASRREG